MIMDEVKRVVSLVRADGHTVSGTVELNNVISEFYPHTMDLRVEEEEISREYSKFGSWADRQKLESNHYKFITASVIHKVGEVLYFHKNENMHSRKFIIFSNDCISVVHFIHRENHDLLNVFVRSSDSVNLLCSDYLFACRLLKSIQEEFTLKSNLNDKITFFISSCHYYLRDKDIVSRLLGVKKLSEFR